MFEVELEIVVEPPPPVAGGVAVEPPPPPPPVAEGAMGGMVGAVTVYEIVFSAAQQFLLDSVLEIHLEIYDPAERPGQLNIALFPDQLL
jgi:hypothetical protein